jgi:hypothetical protein
LILERIRKRLAGVARRSSAFVECHVTFWLFGFAGGRAAHALPALPVRTTIALMTTTLRIGSPVRYGDWGLTVDKMDKPSEYVVLRYLTKGRRHAEPYDEVRVPYVLSPDLLAAKTNMPLGTANVLVNAVELKRLSPKAADADEGYRPVR